jgi:hypothetical protein
MYTSIRHYTFKDAIDKKSLDDYIGRIESKFVPGVQALPGFHSYYLVKLRENEIVGIGIFEDKSSADASSRWAAEFVKSDAIKDRINAPDITEGELLISRESPVTA